MVQEPTFEILWSCRREHSDWSRNGPTKGSCWSGTDLRNSSEPSKGVFRLVGIRTDEAHLLVGNRPSKFFGAVKRSIPIGQEADRRSAPIGREPTFGILRSCQREHFDWSRSELTKRSYWSGRPSEFFGAVKGSIPIGQEANRRSAPIVRGGTKRKPTNHDVEMVRTFLLV